MAADASQPRPAAVAFERRLPPPSRLLAVALPILLLASLLLARGLPATRPISLVGAQDLTPSELTDAAADSLTTALASAGVAFEIVQTSTIAAKPGGPPVEIAHPTDREASLGTAERLVMGTLIERGFISGDGYWMELIHGPEPGLDAEYDLATAQVSRQALIRDGVLYRNDGEGWHATEVLPGIGLDPATIALLPELLTLATEPATDRTTEPDAPLAETAREPGLDVDELATYERLTTPVDPADLATSVAGLEGTADPVVRSLERAATAELLPGIIAIDLASSTEFLAPIELRFDDAGRLIGLTVLARNTRLDVHDLVVETHISLRYLASAPELPKPEPVYVEPSPAPDNDSETTR